MESSQHNMSNLFAQLGQACDEEAISSFIESHRPLPNGLPLHEATFWTVAQAQFLREAMTDDADWAEMADTLNSALHARH